MKKRAAALSKIRNNVHTHTRTHTHTDIEVEQFYCTLPRVLCFIVVVPGHGGVENFVATRFTRVQVGLMVGSLVGKQG